MLDKKSINILLKNNSVVLVWQNRVFFNYILKKTKLVNIYNKSGSLLSSTSSLNVVYFCSKVLQNFGLILHHVNNKDWKNIKI